MTPRRIADNICMFTPASSGGHALYTRELLTALAGASDGRYRCHLVSGEDLAPRFREAPYDIHPILPTLRHRAAYRSRLSWVLSRLTYYRRRDQALLEWLRGRPEVSVVHLQEWTPWLAAALIRRIQAMGKRVYFTVHNVLPHRYRATPKPVMHACIRAGCRACDGLFVHSEGLADELAAFLRHRHPPIHVIPHGVWTVDAPAPAELLAELLPERLALKRLLFFGAIRRNKGLEFLLRAAERLPDYHLTLAGESDDPDYFSKLILPAVRRLQSLGRRVELIDRFVADDEVGRLFATHSAVVLPYTRQFVAQSGVAFMALAYGVPVVASGAGALGELLERFPFGTVCRTSTADGLVEAIRTLCEATPADQLAKQIGLARRYHSWDAAARATLRGYSVAPHAVVAGNVAAIPASDSRADDRLVETTSSH